MLKKALIKNAAFGVSQARALLYTLESLPLPVMNRVIAGQQRSMPSREQQEYVVEQVRRLIELDANDFGSGVFPLDTLAPESPITHFTRWAQILGDSATSFWRRRHNKTAEFSKKVKHLKDYPKYYQRNFHHQTDGYLSERSAYFYEHQVELLFRGLADPMRRRMIPAMRKKLGKTRKPKILEIACGAGTFTRTLSKVFPEASITAIDLSPQYVQFAKKRFTDVTNVDFMVANAEDLPFKDETFDAVVSVFLHHELPRKVREQVLTESLRVCKPNSFWGLVDSIQKDDDPQLNWAIEDFPKTFHEPYFTNYIKNPMAKYLKENHEGNFKEKVYLLSKVLYRD